MGSMGAEIDKDIARPTRRVVSILYADIVASSKILNQLNLDDAAEFLDPIINSVIRAVHAYGGLVVRVQGDGVMAVFGAKRVQEDHALRAVLTGQQIVDIIQNTPAQKNIPKADMRVGIHSGYVIVRWQNTDFGGGLDTVGSTAHIASKVEAATMPNRVWFTEATADLLPKGVDYTDASHCTKKSDILEMNLFELKNIQAEFITGPSYRDLTLPLVGREAEFNKLKSYVYPSGDKARQPCTIIGEAGVGKSRLVSELALLAVQKNMRAETFNAPPVFASSPYHLIANMAARLIGVERMVALTKEILHPKFSLGKKNFEALLHLIGPGNNRLANWDLYVNEKAATINRLMSKILHATSNETPLMLIIEDVHNIDSESLACLKVLSRGIDNIRTSLVFTTRPQLNGQIHKITDNEIKLESLDYEQTEILLSTFCRKKGARILSDKRLGEIAERSGGLPLAALELFKHSMLNKLSNKGDVFVSLELEPVFHSKLDAIGKDARQLLDYASVLGSETRVNFLLETLDWKKPKFDKSMKQIFEHNLLIAPIPGQIAFTHHLLHEISYGAIPKQRRQNIHKQIYNFMCDRNDFSSDILAYHAEACGKFEQALKHLWTACEQALAQAANRTVIGLFNRAENILKEMGLSGEIYHIRFALLVFGAHHQLALQENLRELFERATGNPNISLPHLENVALHANLAMIHWIAGRHTEGYIVASKAVNSLKRDDPLQLTWLVQFVLANLEFAIGKPQDSIDRFLRQAKLLSGEHAAITSSNSTSLGGVMVRVFAVWHMSAIESWTNVEKLLEEALDIAASNDHAYSMTLYNTTKGYFYITKGDWEAALPYLEEGYLLARMHSFSGNTSYANCWYARALIGTNQLEKAQKILDEEKESEGFKFVKTSSTYYYYNSRSHLNYKLGNYDEAVAYSLQAIQHAEQCPDPVNLAHANYEHAVLLEMLEKDFSDICRYFEAAKKHATACDMRVLAGRCTQALKKY